MGKKLASVVGVFLVVALLSGCGTTGTTVPNLIGDTPEIAEAMIHGAGLKPARERYDDSDDRPGFVISNSPKAGERVAKVHPSRLWWPAARLLGFPTSWHSRQITLSPC